MPIIYNKLFALLAERGLNAYTLKKENVVGNATIEKLQKNQGNIDTRSIVRLCKYLQCQPGDIMEYVEDDAE
ncbi:MAG: helix-turn-helix domain-containing protein [Dysosmobacter sp.]|nr:helix-turn-helix domain-containing protein [Dysosmobacter sp.]